MRYPILFALLVTLCVGGCDSISGNGVSGRVVDSATGLPVSPGVVGVRVYGLGGLLSAPRLYASGATEADGSFSFPELQGDPDRVFFDASGVIDYPGVDTTGLQLGAGGFRLAYFDLRVSARSNFGTVEMHPSCTALGGVRLSRPLREGEHLDLRLASVPDVPGRFASETIKFKGEPLDSLRFLSVGGREARLEWAVQRGGQGADVASGVVPLAVCPRHGVLDWSATLDLG